MIDNMNTMNEKLKYLCEEYRRHNGFNASDYQTYGVKRGLRNPDGTGVMAGLTNICNVHGFMMADGVRVPDEGKLIYRGRCLQKTSLKNSRISWAKPGSFPIIS